MRFPAWNVYRDSNSYPTTSRTHVFDSSTKSMENSRFPLPLQKGSDSSCFLQKPDRTRKWRIVATSGSELPKHHFPASKEFKSVYAVLRTLNSFPPQTEKMLLPFRSSIAIFMVDVWENYNLGFHQFRLSQLGHARPHIIDSTRVPFIFHWVSEVLFRQLLPQNFCSMEWAPRSL